MKLTETSQFKQRLIVSSLLTMLFFVVVNFSYSPIFAPIFILMVALFQSLSLWEYYALSKAKGFDPLIKLGIGANVAYVIATYCTLHFPHLALLPECTLFAALAIFFLVFFKKGAPPLGNLAVTVFGLAYLTIPLSCVIDINYFHFDNVHQDGRWWLIYLFGVTKITDMGAYFFGKTYGKTPLAPQISPKKTVEGAIGGLACSIVLSFIFYCIVNLFANPPMVLTFWNSIWLGILLSAVGQFGDLAESLLKRDADVKDSSHLPGLGGFLDIADSIIFTAPLLYLFLKLKF